MTETIVEAVTFKLRPDVSDKAFLAVAAAIEHFVRRQDGFLRRRLSKGDDGVWLDHVEWRDLAAAKAAADAFGAEPSLAPVIQAIDHGTVVMRHNRLLAAQD